MIRPLVCGARCRSRAVCLLGLVVVCTLVLCAVVPQPTAAFELRPEQEEREASWLEGRFDWRRVTGRVLKLPAYEITDAHRERAEEINSWAGVEAELRLNGPSFAALLGAVFAFRLLVTKFWIRPTARKLIPESKRRKSTGRKVELTVKQRQKEIYRFECSMWEAIFYTLSFCYGMVVLAHEEWTVWPTTNIWMGWPHQPMSGLLWSYYMMGLAFYSQALLSLLFLDPPRSDFVEYLIHHLVTIFLIGTSFYARIPRTGLLILLLHDAGDVFLNYAKASKYLGPKWEHFTTFSFISFIVTFFGTRLVFLPITIIPSCYWEAMQMELIVPLLGYMVGALCVLQCLHIFWFYLVLKAVNRFVTLGDADDTREKDD